jgi:hypothetical protein
VKSLALPYTIIDIGWWFQLTLPTSFYDIGYGDLPGTMPGDGNVVSAFTDARDVGKFVVETIIDRRTINKSVFCYSEMMSMNQVYDVLDRVSGRRFDRNYVCCSNHSCLSALDSGHFPLTELQTDFRRRDDRQVGRAPRTRTRRIGRESYLPVLEVLGHSGRELGGVCQVSWLPVRKRVVSGFEGHVV